MSAFVSCADENKTPELVFCYKDILFIFILTIFQCGITVYNVANIGSNFKQGGEVNILNSCIFRWKSHA